VLYFHALSLYVIAAFYVDLVFGRRAATAMLVATTAVLVYVRRSLV